MQIASSVAARGTTSGPLGRVLPTAIGMGPRSVRRSTASALPRTNLLFAFTLFVFDFFNP